MGTSVPFGYKSPSSCLTCFKYKCSVLSVKAGLNKKPLVQFAVLDTLSGLLLDTPTQQQILYPLSPRSSFEQTSFVSETVITGLACTDCWLFGYFIFLLLLPLLIWFYLQGCWKICRLVHNSSRNVTFCNSQSHEKPREKCVRKVF